MLVAGGSTNVTTYFAMRLAADGTAATGLTITNFDLQYVRSGAAPSAKADATALAATDSAHGDNQAIEIDATDQPGLYRVDWPDAAFAAGVREVILTVKVATCFTEHKSVEIDAEVTAEALGTQAKADVNAEADTALTDYDPPTRAELTTDIGTVVTDLDDIKGTGFVKDTHSLVDIEGYVDLIDDGTSGLAKIATDAAAILVDTAVIGAAGAGLTEAGGTGDQFTAVPWNAAWDVEVQSECTDALNAYDPPTNAEMEARTLPAAEIGQLTQNLDNCLTGTASGTPTTTTMVSDVAVTVDDQFNGRIVTFDDDTTTAALRRQSTDITGCTAASNTLTFTALTTAPVSGDTFTIT